MTDDDATAQKRAVQSGYDEVVDAYDDNRGTGGDRELLGELFQRLPADAKLLDAGCGAGRSVLENLEEFDVAASAAVGLDISTEQLRLARDRTDAGVVAGDMVRLPFASDSFDAVTAFYAVIHLPWGEHGDCFAEVARVLDSGGWFLLTVAEDAWEGENSDWLDSGVSMQWSFPDIEETRTLLRDAGFEVVEQFSAESEMDEVDWPFLLCRLEE